MRKVNGQLSGYLYCPSCGKQNVYYLEDVDISISGTPCQCASCGCQFVDSPSFGDIVITDTIAES